MRKRIRQAQIIMFPGGFSAGDEPEGSGKFIATLFRNPALAEALESLLYKRDGLVLGVCNGFQALIKLGLLPYGHIQPLKADSPTLTYNTIGRHLSRMVDTKVVSVMSPWFSNVRAGDIHTVAISHGEGRFVASPEQIRQLAAKGQIATQYVDLNGKATYDSTLIRINRYLPLKVLQVPMAVFSERWRIRNDIRVKRCSETLTVIRYNPSLQQVRNISNNIKPEGRKRCMILGKSLL